MSDQKPTQKEKKSLRLEVLEQVVTLATSGFGLVAALAWNEAIKAFFTQFFPEPGNNWIALLVYALFITILVVFITTKLGRVLNLAKKQLKQEKE
jgi:membrane protein YdbS with pleckstrin-like domain